MATKRERIGILGGTFNPIHFGHLLIAQDAMEQLRLDRVKFIPSAQPPHKRYEGNATAAQRLAMIRLAVRGNPRFEVDDIEIRRGGTSYTVDTLAELRRRHPSARFWFIIGADSLRELHRWREVERLVRMCAFVTVARPGFQARPMVDPRLDAETRRRLRQHVLKGHACDIASRDVPFPYCAGRDDTLSCAACGTPLHWASQVISLKEIDSHRRPQTRQTLPYHCPGQEGRRRRDSRRAQDLVGDRLPDDLLGQFRTSFEGDRRRDRASPPRSGGAPASPRRFSAQPLDRDGLQRRDDPHFSPRPSRALRPRTTLGRREESPVSAGAVSNRECAALVSSVSMASLPASRRPVVRRLDAAADPTPISSPAVPV